MKQISTSLQEKVSALAEKLRTSQRPVIVCGTQTVRQETPALAADAALLLQAAGKQAGLFYILPGANAFAAGWLSEETGSFETLVDDIEKDSIKGLILVESNPFWDFPDRQRLEKALARLELMVVLDYLNSEAVPEAHIFLPTTTLYETGGVYINQEARLQAAQPAHKGGIPIAQIGGGGHPPRVYGTVIPGAEPAAAWQLLASLIDGERHPTAKDLKAGIWNRLAKTESAFKEMAAIEKIPDDGMRIYREKDRSARFSIQRLKSGSDVDDRMELIAVEWIFGTEELSSYSECLTDLEGSPGICMCRRDAEKLNLIAGDRVAIELDRGTLEANIRVKDNMAAGTLIIPRHKNLDWQTLDSGKTWVRPDQIRKLKD
jgi:NADH-quinone oxidoreductase subunit G